MARLPAVEREGSSFQDLDALDTDRPEDETYFAIAEERLSGALPQRASESELMRRYDVPRSRLLKVLHRIAEEGWHGHNS